MLRKLIKHEFRATSRIMWPIFAGMLALTLVMRAAMYMTNRYWGGFDTARFFSTLYSLLFLAYIFGLAALCLAPLVLSAVRFRNHILKDEGYLTLTLPVNMHQLLTSKLLVSAVWYAAAFLSMLFFVFLLGFDSARDWLIIPNFLGDAFVYFGRLDAVTRGQALLFLLEFVLAGIFGVTASFLTIYAAYAIGYSFNRHKSAITAVLILFLYQFMQFIVLRVFFGMFGGPGPILSTLSGLQAGNAALGILLVGELAVCVVFYFVTKFFLTKKLNLE